MKALSVMAPKRLEVADVPVPDTGPDGVLIRVHYAGVCGTDLAIYTGEMKLVKEGQIKYPVRIGHEWSGIVEKVGPAVTQFKPGDRVVSETGVACGICEACLVKDYNSCKDGRSVGTVKCWDGAFAEFIMIPERHVCKIPDDMSLEYSVLAEPGSIVMAGLVRYYIKGKDILVVGTGVIGLLSVVFAKTLGAGKIYVAGRKASKLDVAKTIGADEVVNSTEQDLTKEIMRLTDGRGVDLVWEASGNPDVINDCIMCTAKNGDIALLGFYEEDVPSFDVDRIVTKSITMKGILGMLGLLEQTVNLLSINKKLLAPLLTHTFPFEDVIRVFETADDKADTKIKMLIKIAGD